MLREQHKLMGTHSEATDFTVGLNSSLRAGFRGLLVSKREISSVSLPSFEISVSCSLFGAKRKGATPPLLNPAGWGDAPQVLEMARGAFAWVTG